MYTGLPQSNAQSTDSRIPANMPQYNGRDGSVPEEKARLERKKAHTCPNDQAVGVAGLPK
jgi:hypothetical protein